MQYQGLEMIGILRARGGSSARRFLMLIIFMYSPRTRR